MNCRVCRRIPRGLRDWLLEIFAAGDREHYLYPQAEAYARWGARNVINGASVAFPILTGKPGKADPFDVLRIALDFTDTHGFVWAVEIDGQRVRFGPGEKPPPDDAPDLTPASPIARLLAGHIDADERTAVSLVREAASIAISFGGLVLTPIILCNRPYTSEKQ